MTKFNVGDKVQFIENYSDYKIGDVVKVTGFWRSGIEFVGKHGDGSALYERFKLAELKPTKNQRITALENEVAELKLIVHELRERPQLTTVINNAPQGPSTTNTVEGYVPKLLNAQEDFKGVIEFEGRQYRKVDRKALEGDVVIIRKPADNNRLARLNTPYKVVVDEHQRLCINNPDDALVYNNILGRTSKTVEVYELIQSKPLTPNQQRAAIIEKAKKFVDEHKSKYRSEWNIVGHTVQILIYDSNGMLMMFRQAKCNPSDVFNENIGKAIALGRALGLDVSEFEQAVQPNEAVYGMIMERYSVKGEYREVAPNYVHFKTCTLGSDTAKYGRIINDTNAIY